MNAKQRRQQKRRLGRHPEPPEYLALNNSPLNQRAKKVLKQLGQEPDPTNLHSLQLARHGLKEMPAVGTEGEYLPALRNKAAELLNENPEEVQPYLVPPGADLQEDWLPTRADPESLAAEMASTFADNAQNRHPLTGPPSEQEMSLPEHTPLTPNESPMTTPLASRLDPNS